MKNGLKTAIRIVSEEDRQELIPFFESLGGVNEYLINEDDTRIGDIWYISTDKNKILINVTLDLQSLDYTIIQGIPENWREEMETPKLINVEVADQYQGLFNLLSKEHGLILTISEMDEIVIEAAKISESKINQLETRIKELEDFLETVYKSLMTYGKHPIIDEQYRKIKAKQLLNK